MSDDPHHGATEIRAAKGGSGGKWLLGALAAVVLVGGGYAAWTTLSSSQNEDQYAINNAYDDDADPLRATPLDSEDRIENEDGVASSASESAAPTPAPARRAATSSASTRTASAQDIPETTIGITPISASSDYTDGENVVVTAPRRPIWTRTPSARRLSALYPARQLEREREGEARLACLVEQNGELDCENVEQTPGFGGAALRVASTLRHAGYLADGRSAVGTPVNLRVVFRMEDETRRS